jgi:hypothetical protein
MVIGVGAGHGEQFKTGNSGAPHVHWQLERNQVLVDPLSGAPLLRSTLP